MDVRTDTETRRLIRQAKDDVQRFQALVLSTPVDHLLARAMYTKDLERALMRHKALTFDEDLLK